MADYAPFYFNPRSPMQFSIHCGNVPSYREGTDRLIFLVSSTQQLRALGLKVIVSDRNAVLSLANFTDTDDLDDFVAWDVISAQYWNDFLDGKELRHAECLVHRKVPWEAFIHVGCKSESIMEEASAILAMAPVVAPRLDVRRGWYF